MFAPACTSYHGCTSIPKHRCGPLTCKDYARRHVGRPRTNKHVYGGQCSRLVWPIHFQTLTACMHSHCCSCHTCMHSVITLDFPSLTGSQQAAAGFLITAWQFYAGQWPLMAWFIHFQTLTACMRIAAAATLACTVCLHLICHHSQVQSRQQLLRLRQGQRMPDTEDFNPCQCPQHSSMNRTARAPTSHQITAPIRYQFSHSVSGLC